MYLPLSPGTIVLNKPLPVDLWNDKGVLLMARGEVVESREQLQKLLRHEPKIRINGRSAADLLGLSQAAAADVDAEDGANSQGISRALSNDPVQGWTDLHARLSPLLRQNVEAQEFNARLLIVVRLARQLIDRHPDDSLFVLLQMLFDRQVSYSATHALTCAAVCHLVASQSGMSSHDQDSLFCAALTMNIGMSRLHDQLAMQKQPVDEMQRAEIHAHPAKGVEILKTLDITDDLWLQLVLEHHESPDGKGYPSGKTDLSYAQQLLRMTDLFIARISPRQSRRGLLPQQAVRHSYVESKGKEQTLGALFVRTIGLYPPGSYVTLANGETAVVMRRGEKATTPLVLAVVNAQGEPLSIPALRDTQRATYAIRESVAADDIRIRLDASRMIRRV